MSKLLVFVTVTRYELGGPGFGIPLGLNFFHISGLALKPTHTSCKMGTGAACWG